MTTHAIGMLSLNISFVLYLLVYLPQIVHNRETKHIQNLSISMHGLLYLGLLLDLLYGFSSGLQWQYKTVSIVSLSVMSIQHLQMTRHFWLNSQRLQVGIQILILIATMSVLVCFFALLDRHLPSGLTLTIGYISRICCLSYALPQIIKNTKLTDANAISVRFIALNMVLIILDIISSWCLDWGWPNKLSTPISLIFMIILLVQQRGHALKRKDIVGDFPQSLSEVVSSGLVRESVP
ncbi:MAG: PQ-loop domain-containing transporter [Legionellaceae bacterium]|nr:PQ-loop domain-containing transporter [Legionellaceae bacterium]